MSLWNIRTEQLEQHKDLFTVFVNGHERYHIFRKGVRRLFGDGAWLIICGAGNKEKIARTIALDIINNDTP